MYVLVTFENVCKHRVADNYTSRVFPLTKHATSILCFVMCQNSVINNVAYWDMFTIQRSTVRHRPIIFNLRVIDVYGGSLVHNSPGMLISFVVLYDCMLYSVLVGAFEYTGGSR